MTPHQRTITDLFAFIADLPATRGIAPRTADAYRTAIRVMQDVLDIGPDTNVDDLDIDEIAQRLHDRTAGRYTHHSIATYTGNIRRVIDLFAGRMPDWKMRPRPGHHASVTSETTIAYKIQLRPGKLVVIHLPADLTRAEAKRLATFITSLPVGAPDVAQEASPPTS